MKTDHTGITLAAYNKNADKYADKFMAFKSYQEKLSRFQQRYLPEHASILDVGCGPGNTAKFLMGIDNHYTITGIDLSVEMITIARQNVPGCNFSIQDIRDIIPDKEYDAVIASFCIVHLSDQETTVLIQTLSKMLKPNGSLYISFMEGKSPGLETTSFSDEKIFFNYFPRDRIKGLLAANSVETVELLVEGYPEQDGSITKDIFVFARKRYALTPGIS
ncbi:class I SAM-dependent methyltransferase [Desulfobacula sp.]|uniref:class I SAM-dependent methyltransferase n=1 Tax=Desulfobacula sp. TaxID=2593537 RepID=UPI0026369EDA|nr:class I SAM-dependent methyltransferase [Desulfobacula sp.]